MSGAASSEREAPAREEEEALLTASHVLNQQALRQGAAEVRTPSRQAAVGLQLPKPLLLGPSRYGGAVTRRSAAGAWTAGLGCNTDS